MIGTHRTASPWSSIPSPIRSPGDRTSRTDDENEDGVLEVLRKCESTFGRVGDDNPELGSGIGFDGYGERVLGTLTEREAEGM